MKKQKITNLIEHMYQQLSSKNAVSFRLKAQYEDVKKNWKRYLLDEMDISMKNEVRKES